MKTIKITETAYEILSIIKFTTRSKTFSETILKMDEGIRTFAPLDCTINRTAINMKAILPIYDKSKK